MIDDTSHNPRHRFAWLGLGIILGTLVWSLGLSQGFEVGYDQGIQDQETGNVQYVAVSGFFDQSFTLRALLSGLVGVEAVSPRLETHMTVWNPQCDGRTSLIRGVNFAQEDRVTAFQGRIQNGIFGPVAGLIVPESWLQESFVSLGAILQLTGPSGISREVPITGILKGAFTAEEQGYAVLDLETTRELMGIASGVSSFALKLDPRFEVDRWISANQDSVQGWGGAFRSWRELSGPWKGRIFSQAGLYLFVVDGVTVGCLLLCLGWSYRMRDFWVATGSSNPPLGVTTVVSVMVFLAAAGFTWFSLWETFPLWSRVLTHDIVGSYPFPMDHQVPWNWGPSEWFISLAAILFAFGSRILRLNQGSVNLRTRSE